MIRVSQQKLDAAVSFLREAKGNVGDAIFWSAAGIKLASAGVYLLDKAGYGTAIPQALRTSLEWAKKQFGEVAFWTGVALLALEHGGKLLVDEDTAQSIDTSKVTVERLTLEDFRKMMKQSMELTPQGRIQSIQDSLDRIRKMTGQG